MRKLTALLLVASFAFSAPAFAGPGDRRERVQNHVETADAHRDRADDVRDLNQLVNAIDEWHTARRSGSLRAERAADARLESWIRRELAEDRGEVRETQREVGRSTAERNRSRAERNRDVRRGRPLQAADDTRDLRDDRRDLRDDRADAAAAQRDLQRTRAIARELEGMQPAFASGSAGPRLYAQKTELLNELAGLARAEIRRDSAEIREDRGERHEDRRERRERS